MKSDLTKDKNEENDFLIEFHKKHFSGTDIPIHSKEVLYKLIEEIKMLEKGDAQ